MTDEKKPYVPPMLRTVECFCSMQGQHPDLAVHSPVCPVSRIGKHRILKPEEFIELYAGTLVSLLAPLGDLFPRTIQVRADLDIMLAPICPRCYERDGSLVQTSEPRRLCVPCSRELEP